MDGAGIVGNLMATLTVVHSTAVTQSSQFDVEAWLQLIILIISLILCAMASAAETALTSVNRIKLKNLVEEGDKKALEIERLIAKPNVFLTTIHQDLEFNAANRGKRSFGSGRRGTQN